MDGLEVEVKLLADSEGDLCALAGLRELAGCRVEPAADRTQEDTYLDTADFAVFRSGRALRHRRKGGRVRATLKDLGPADEDLLHRRREVTEDLPEGAGFAPEGSDIRREISPLLGGRELRPVVRVATRRRKLELLRRGEVAAELCLDSVEVLPGAGGEPLGRFFEVECEDRGGGRDLVLAAGHELLDHPGLAPSGRTKLERALALAGLLDRASGTGGIVP